MTATPLSSTPRTTIGRGRDRAVADRADLVEFLDQASVAHVGLIMGEHPVVLPTAYAVDPDGPDPDGSLYLHGSVAAGWLRSAIGATVCVTVTEVDGLVLARSGFHHSMNYRSAVVLGATREVSAPEERDRALDRIVDHMVPGRAAGLRPHTRKELAATRVLAVPLAEASMKQRSGGPVDDPADAGSSTWAGHLPMRRVYDAPVSAPDSHDDVPDHVLRASTAGRA